jgi:hypothetical protein
LMPVGFSLPLACPFPQLDFAHGLCRYQPWTTPSPILSFPRKRESIDAPITVARSR